MNSLVFDKYEVLKRLAVGGMGEIFLARQHGVAGFDRLAILKSLLPDLADSAEAVEQFLDEARVAATLNHPNIVSIYEVGKWDGVYFIAMEYIEGENVGILVRTIKERKQHIPFAVSARIVHDAAIGLDHAHHARSPTGKPLMIVHRDVSPQNIMVRVDGVTKVVDFGVAKAANRSTRTATGVLKGKLRYMPPEQINGGEIDQRSDQFSLGVVFWEMLTGQRLFNKADGDDISTIRLMLREPIPPPSTIVPTLPKELEWIVMRMLQRDANERYNRCRDLASELMRWLERASEHAEEDVIRVVGETLGHRIQSKTSDLTPSRENFFISLSERTEISSSKEAVTTPARISLQQQLPTQQTQLTPPQIEEPPSPKRRGLAIGFSIVAVGLALSGGIMVGLSKDETQIVSVQALVPVAATTSAIELAEPAGAMVTVDGKSIGLSPVRVDPLEPGTHEVRIELAGHQPIVRSLTLRAGEAMVLREHPNPLPSTLELETTPPGATVRTGAIVLGTTPLAVKTLAAGVKHELSIDRAEFLSKTVSIELRPGESRTLSVALERAPIVAVMPKERHPSQRKIPATPVEAKVERTGIEIPSQAQAMGYLTVSTEPWTRVTIGGEPQGITPLFKLRLPPGKHIVRMTNERENIDTKQTVEIKSGEVAKLNLKLGH